MKKRTQEQIEEARKPFLYDEKEFSFLSLSKFVGKKIKDIVGYTTAPFDSETYVFHIFKVVFEDDTEVYIEGEHDMAYIPADDKIKELNIERLEQFSDLNDEEEDESE